MMSFYNIVSATLQFRDKVVCIILADFLCNVSAVLKFSNEFVGIGVFDVLVDEKCLIFRIEAIEQIR